MLFKEALLARHFYIEVKGRMCRLVCQATPICLIPLCSGPQSLTTKSYADFL